MRGIFFFFQFGEVSPTGDFVLFTFLCVWVATLCSWLRAGRAWNLGYTVGFRPNRYYNNIIMQGMIRTVTVPLGHTSRTWINADNLHMKNGRRRFVG